MVLRGDGNLASFEILDRLIAATVAEFEFEGFRAERVRNDLVTETDAKCRGVLYQFLLPAWYLPLRPGPVALPAPFAFRRCGESLVGE